MLFIFIVKNKNKLQYKYITFVDYIILEPTKQLCTTFCLYKTPYLTLCILQNIIILIHYHYLLYLYITKNYSQRINKSNNYEHVMF